MDYKEYRKSAIRHLQTCQYLLKDIDSHKTELQKNFLLNVYYLSGYVVETALSYAFFSHIKHKGDVATNIDYKNRFKTHNFNTKVKVIYEKRGNLSSVPFVHRKIEDPKLTLLFNSWSTDFRYCTNDTIKEHNISEEILRKYLSHLEELLKIILNRF